MTRKAIEVWEVRSGKFVRHYATEHHAEQMARALKLNGMLVEVTRGTLPSDALTRLVAH